MSFSMKRFTEVNYLQFSDHSLLSEPIYACPMVAIWHNSEFLLKDTKIWCQKWLNSDFVIQRVLPMLTKFWIIKTTATPATSIDIHLFYQACNILLLSSPLFLMFLKMSLSILLLERTKIWWILKWFQLIRAFAGKIFVSIIKRISRFLVD